MKWLIPASIAVLAGVFSRPVSAQLVSDVNIFNTGSHEATVTMNTEYSDTTFPHQDAVDGTTAQVYFGDYLRPGGSNTSIDDQLMTISGFTASSGIDSLRLYRSFTGYEPGRLATQVTIYYSLSNTTSQDPGNFIALNGGNPYTLPVTSGTYTDTSASGFNYDTLTGLNIPLGAQSVLLDFGPERDAYGAPGSTYNVGVGFAEIQAFAPVPEPATYAMMALASVGLAGLLRLRRAA